MCRDGEPRGVVPGGGERRREAAPGAPSPHRALRRGVVIRGPVDARHRRPRGRPSLVRWMGQTRRLARRGPRVLRRGAAYPPSQPHEALRGCLRLTGRPRDCSQYWCDRCTGCRCVGQNGAVARLSQVWATVAQLSPANRRRAPGCSQRCACMLPVSQGDCGRAPVHARCSVPWRRSPAASGATAGISCASGAVAGDSQAPCPVAALSRADFLHGTDSAIYPGQAAAGCVRRTKLRMRPRPSRARRSAISKLAATSTRGGWSGTGRCGRAR